MEQPDVLVKALAAVGVGVRRGASGRGQQAEGLVNMSFTSQPGVVNCVRPEVLASSFDPLLVVAGAEFRETDDSHEH